MACCRNRSEEIDRTATWIDRHNITFFKSRAWRCCAFDFNVFGQAGLFAPFDVCQKLEFPVAALEHLHYFRVKALSRFANDLLTGFFQFERRTLLVICGMSIQAVYYC